MILATAEARHPEPLPWHRQSAEAVLLQLGSTASGLSAPEAARRLTSNGRNELKEGEHISALQIFLGQFKSLIVWILIGAGVISGVLGDVVDAIAILAIVVLNAVIGFYQEFNAEKSIAALKKMTAPRAKVRRQGKVTSIPASQIVPGDIIELDAGDLVAADARLLASASLKCIESALTGESDAVEKQAVTLDKDDLPLGDRENMVFLGTGVATGQGRAVVVATGMQTEIGRIAGLIEDAGTDTSTPLQQKLDSFGRVLVWASLGIVALLFVVGLLRGLKFYELFMTSVSLAVAAVPEGLPAGVTVSLALGVVRMSRRRALVRKLPAVETLGSTTVICADKTGVLTAGVSFAVYLYGLKTGTPELARTHAFAVLVFAELLRSFGCRSETKLLWRIPLLTNLNLALVVALSFALQVWSHDNETLSRLLKTSIMSLSDCLMLLAVSVIPLAVLEGVKYWRNQPGRSLARQG